MAGNRCRYGAEARVMVLENCQTRSQSKFTLRASRLASTDQRKSNQELVEAERQHCQDSENEYVMYAVDGHHCVV